ncbi:MAG: DUF1570 domain-containing protein, partial [Proteobacteria bacterium]|nr:DUF1570 domain-containing protein [Pseudomonadota bacterium]
QALAAPSTPHIRIIEQGLDLPVAAEQRIRDGIARIHAFYAQTGPLPPDLVLTIRVFGSRAEFLRHSPPAFQDVVISGLFFEQSGEILVDGERTEEQIVKTALHEASHQLLASFAGPTPLWLNEGLAEYFEELAPERDGAVIHAQFTRDDIVRSSLWDRSLAPLPLSLFFDAEAWQRLSDDERQHVRNIAWSLFYYLMEDAQRRERVVNMLADLHHPETLSDAELLMRLSPDGMTLLLEAQWRDFLLRSRQPHGL